MIFNSGLILGFHGCEKDIALNAILNKEPLHPSANDYDWLGAGIYFWENDPIRALEFAKDVKKCKKPFVVGAIINLGYCLDLSTRIGLERVEMIWENIVRPTFEKGELRSNKPGRKGENGELMLRFLDCHVIEALHKFNNDRNYQEFDTVRSPFWEGAEIYPTAGFFIKNHIQLCVRNKDCIIGYFMPKGFSL